MNWKLHGVIYPPYARRYDRKKEGNEAWLSRMTSAALVGSVTLADGTPIAPRAFCFDEENR